MAQSDKLRTVSGAILSVLRGHDLTASDFAILARLIQRMKLEDGHWAIIKAWKRALATNRIPESFGDFGLEENLISDRRKHERINAHLSKNKERSPYKEK